MGSSPTRLKNPATVNRLNYKSRPATGICGIKKKTNWFRIVHDLLYEKQHDRKLLPSPELPIGA